METAFKKALNQIKADDNLKQKTAEYILKADSNVISINSAAALKKKPQFTKRLIAAACIAAVFCALPIGTYAYYKTPTSYVSIDINPSIELGINSFGKVVSVKAYNLDGETVIAGLSLLNSNVESAVKHIVKSAAQNGFIKDDGSSFISVTAETNSDKKAEELKQDAQAGAIDAIDSEDDTATIQADNMALDRRDEALDLGITPGKLNLIQKLQDFDPEIKTEDYKDSSVSDIQKRYSELKKENSGKDDKDDPDEDGAPSPSVSPSASPDASPSAVDSPDNSAKPGNHSNGNNNGNGSNKHDEENSRPSPGSNPESSPSITPSHNDDSDPRNHNNNNDNYNPENDHGYNDD